MDTAGVFLTVYTTLAIFFGLIILFTNLATQARAEDGLGGRLIALAFSAAFAVIWPVSIPYLLWYNCCRSDGIHNIHARPRFADREYPDYKAE